MKWRSVETLKSIGVNSIQSGYIHLNEAAIVSCTQEFDENFASHRCGGNGTLVRMANGDEHFVPGDYREFLWSGE